MKFLVVLVILVGFGETYRTSVRDRCDLTLEKDGYVIYGGGQALGIGGDLNQVYCKALCSGPGPTPALRWYKESRRRISYSKRRVYQVRTTSDRINILTIRNMKYDDAGRYTCRGWISGQGWIKTSYELVYGCRSSDHLCDQHKCISSDLICNGGNDCRDGTDEQYCDECAADQFQCDNGECVPAVKKCDGYYACVDGSDEYKCGCLPDFTCSHGGCVSQDKVCDGYYDCYVGGDEANCTYCDKDEFHCGKKVCIAGGLVCDGHRDCVDFSDENNCPMKLSIDKRSLEVMVGDTAVFTCMAISRSSLAYKLSWTKDGTTLPDNVTNAASVLAIPDAVTGDSGNYVCYGTDGVTSDNATAELLVNEAKCIDDSFLCPDNVHCITTMQVCDGNNDCGDNWDEKQNCGQEPVCEKDQFACSDGRCINSTHLCDHVDDCRTGEDETSCTCKPVKEFTCTSVEQCIPIDQLCDDHKNCADGSDECGCYPEESEFICDDGLCINKSRQCDNVQDCEGGEDEKDCPKTCIDGQFMCPDGSRCIDTMQVCDGIKDCDNNWDEEQQCE